MNEDQQKGFTNILVVILIVIFAGAAGYLILFKKSPPLPKACTQETRQCPDGSYVSRTGPNCEFAECPATSPPTPAPAPIPVPRPGPAPLPKPDGEQISLREGQRESSFLLEKIYTDRVTGLNFWEYPVVTGQGHPLTLRIGEIVSNGCTITLTLTRIEGNTAVFIKKTDFNRPCPICLTENTLIDTPSGAIPVEHLQKGMAIWTVNNLGERISAFVVETAKTPVPSTHEVIHLLLADGREIFASSGHPIGDGRIMGDLSVGDLMDGGRVITAEMVSYQKGYTYDILPSGETGFYWADGILLDSTIH